MNSDAIWKIFRAHGALIDNTHVVYTSGRHGSTYINKDAVYPDTSAVSQLCLAMAEKYKEARVETVIGPTIGAVILSQWMAHHLSQLTGKNVFSVYSEKTDQGFAIRRGYDQYVKEKRVLVVEDIINTGGSVQKVIEAVKRCAGNIVGVSALCNRGGVTKEALGISRLETLIEIILDSYSAESCPLCQKGVPINSSLGTTSR